MTGSPRRLEVFMKVMGLDDAAVQKDQFDAALEYLGNVGDQLIDWKKFEDDQGVGVEVRASNCALLCTDMCHRLMLLTSLRGPTMRSVLHVMETNAHAGNITQVSSQDIRAAVEAELEHVQDKLLAER